MYEGGVVVLDASILFKVQIEKNEKTRKINLGDNFTVQTKLNSKEFDPV